MEMGFASKLILGENALFRLECFGRAAGKVVRNFTKL
jgi:hypothetical protein